MPMSPDSIISSLEAIGWSERQFAERAGLPRWTVRRALAGEVALGARYEEWLRALATFHRTMKPPKPETSGGPNAA